MEKMRLGGRAGKRELPSVCSLTPQWLPPKAEAWRGSSTCVAGAQWLLHLALFSLVQKWGTGLEIGNEAAVTQSGTNKGRDVVLCTCSYHLLFMLLFHCIRIK